MTKKRTKNDKLYAQAKELRDIFMSETDRVIPPDSLDPKRMDQILVRGQNLLAEEKQNRKAVKRQRRPVISKAAALVMALILVFGVGAYALDGIAEKDGLVNTLRDTEGNILNGTGIFTVAQSFNVGENDYSPIAQYADEIQKIAKESQKQTLFKIVEDAVNSLATDSASSESLVYTSRNNYSETNDQVQNVQEGDIIKTDGNYLYLLSVSGKLVCQKIEKNGDLTQTAAVSLTDEIAASVDVEELFLYNGHIAVIMQGYDNGMKTKVILFDTDQNGDLVRVGDYMQEGSYLSGRCTGGALYVVTNEYAFSVYGENPEDTVPLIWSNGESRSVSTEEMYITACPSYDMTYTNITGYRFGDMTDKVNTVTVLGSSASEIYCTEEDLYLLCTNRYWSGLAAQKGEEMQNTTSVYRYGLENGKITAEAEGKVTGWMLNQFSADEYNGYFRIATTDNNACRVTVLDESLLPVSELTGLAEGERIYACKFMGDTAYLVTFYETDPLFVIDLSDVNDMKMLGELKIPGYSSYLYPLSDRYLVGVGMNTDENGSINGMRINLFDISDPCEPKLADVKILYGDCNALAGENHKAYYADDENGLFGFPIYSYQNGRENFNGFVMFSVEGGKLSVEKEFDYSKDASALSWDTEYYAAYTYNGYYIQRGVYVNDVLYLLSNEHIYAYGRNDFAYLNVFDLD